MPRVTLTCERCGVEFPEHQCYAESRRYCSRDCGNLDRSDGHRCGLCGEVVGSLWMHLPTCSGRGAETTAGAD